MPAALACLTILLLALAVGAGVRWLASRDS